MKNSNRLKTIVSSVLIASSVALINGCCTAHKGGGGAAYYSSYESTPSTAPATTTETRPAETASSGSVTIPLYEENVVVGKREVDAGTVTIKKVVKTETVNQPVELRRETISIDRQPASGTAQNIDQSRAFTDQQFTIQLKKEEPVVEKRVVQTGQVVASKQAQTEQTTVQREIRKEDVAIDKGNADVRTSQGAAGGPGGESQGGASGGTITDLNTLSTTTDASSMHGRMVQCSNAKVLQVVDPSLIVVGGETGQTRVYVHLQQPVQDIKPGDTVSITGTVKKSSKATDITGGLSSTASQTLTAQPFFIEAQSCQKSG
jgi:stress response protein YsnF